MPVAKITIKNNLVAFTCNDEIVRIYDLNGYEDQGEDEEETTEAEQQLPSSQKHKNIDDEEMKQDSDADKEWEDIEDEIDSGSDDSEEEEKQPTNTNSALNFDGKGINWGQDKASMEKKKRQDFFSNL